MVAGSSSTFNYAYDASSNLTTLPNGASGTYNYGSEPTSATLSGNTTTYAYNADGERTPGYTPTNASATWNGGGELTSYSNAAVDMTSATYDGDGLRTSATTSSTTQNFTWDVTPSTPALLMDSTNAYIYGPSGTPSSR